MTKERKTWIDALRAIAIIFVVYGHCAKSFTEFFIFTSPVKLPLFFAISGYVFSMRNGNQRFFWKNWFRKLIIPWFLLALIPELPRLIINPPSFVVYFINLISGKILWFMPCFVIAGALHFYIRKVSKKETGVIILSVISFFIGLIADKLELLNFAMINRALVVQLFFLVGYVFKMHEEWFVKRTWTLLVSGAVIYLSMGVFSCFAYPSLTMDVHMNRYYNYPLCLTMIVLGNFLLFSLFSKGRVSIKMLSFIGQNTLVIFIWHFYTIWVLGYVLSHVFGVYISASCWGAIINTVWACAACGLCAFLINKYFPWMVGKNTVHH